MPEILQPVSAETTENPVFSAKAAADLLTYFRDWVKAAARTYNIPLQDVSISKREFANAIREANTDLVFMRQRRNLCHGVS